MAWELGGPNVPENIVPMYAEWQGSVSTVYPSWRNMEVSLKDSARGHTNQFIFVAVVEYANAGDNYLAQATRFSNWDQLFDWDDYRIPTGFRVYVEPVGSAFGKRLCTSFLTPGGLGVDHATLCGEILTAYNGTPTFSQVWDHSTLPPQDRDALIRNVTAFAVENAWQAHGDQRDIDISSGVSELEGLGMTSGMAQQYAWAPYSPTHDEAYSFIHDHPDEVRDSLETDYNVPHMEALNVTTATMIRGFYHGNPAQRSVKSWVKRRDELKKQRRDLKEKALHDKRAKKYMAKRGVLL
jgi:hypothetical protein